jgi:gliding motility-associated lipoprotein GldD
MKINNSYRLRYLTLAVVPILLMIIACVAGCTKTYTPKPRSYFRIDFPEKEYRSYQSVCNYHFDVPVYARIDPYPGGKEPCWINISFPAYRGTVHITYSSLQDDLDMHIEDIHTLVYKHAIKADDIIERSFSYPERHVFGMIYDIKGNTASSLSFYATDSTANFLSGALYFNVIPNKDSLAPVIRFFTSDVERLIETLHWK